MIGLINDLNVRRLFVATLLYCVIVYGFDMFVFPLTVDEELNMFFTTDYLQRLVGMGRWAAFLINRLVLGYIPVPIVPNVLTMVLLTLSYLILATTWRRTVGLNHYLAMPFAIAYPTLFHIFSFSDFNYIVAFGMLLSSVAVRTLTTPGREGVTIAAICFTVVSGIYQPIVIVAAVTIFSTAAILVDTNREKFWFVTRSLTALAIGVVASAVVTNVWMAVRKLQPNYVDGFYRFDLLLNDPIQAILNTLGYAYRLLSGTDVLFPKPLPILGIAVAMMFIISAFSMVRQRRQLALLALSLGMAASVVAPVINFGDLPFRTMIGLPISLAALAFVASDTSSKAMKTLLAVTASFIGLQFCLMSNHLNYSAYTTWLRDREIASQIIYRIGKDTNAGAEPVIEFVGMPTFDPSPLRPLPWSSLGGSLLQADGGNPLRIKRFLQLMGFSSKELEPSERIIKHREYEALPNWPKEGSVAEIDGVVVVKFSDYTPLQLGFYGLPTSP